jgi:2',3'-cyclic-nucleotide 2'-phosphodiesterase (5'-nucleotidase family)
LKPQKLPLRKRPAFCFSLILFILLTGCSKVLHWSRAEPQFYPVDSTSVDSTVVRMIQPYSGVLSSEMNVVIGNCAQPLQKERPEGTLNNWVADAMKTEAEKYAGTETDFAVSNYGGIRIPTLAAGPVTIGKIYEVMPFDNLLVILEMPGSVVQVFLDHMAADGGWPVSRELRFTISDQRATDITIGGLPLDTGRVYRVVVSEYIANGGDARNYLMDLPRQLLGYLVRDALINNVHAFTAAGQSVNAEKDGRVRKAGAN